MASLYRRGETWWISFTLNDRCAQQSLDTTNERVACDRKAQEEYLLATGGLSVPSQTPIAEFLEDFCGHLKRTRTRKSYKNDVSRLGTFFRPISSSLVPGDTCKKKTRGRKRTEAKDALKNKHVRATLLEQVTGEVVSQFISRRIREDGISSKTVDNLRGLLHKMFVWAIKEKDYRGPDGLKQNPIRDAERRPELCRNEGDAMRRGKASKPP